jgi:putative addiction module component (TIGR02574 family)
MKESTLLPELKSLSIGERMHLIEALWESIVDDHESLELTQAQRDELDRRLDRYRESPGEGISWEEVKAGLDPSP